MKSSDFEQEEKYDHKKLRKGESMVVKMKNQEINDEGSNGNSTIKEHESEDLRESDTFTRQSQDMINMQSSNVLKAYNENDLKFREDSNFFNEEKDKEEQESLNLSEESNDKSISSCSSTSSKISAHPELFHIKVNEAANNQYKDDQTTNGNNIKDRRRSKHEHIMKFTGNLLNLSNLK